MRLNFNKIISTIKHIREYVFPVKKLTDKFEPITTIQQLESFIEERSAHVTQTTLFGYVKTRMGLKYTMMFENKSFLDSLEIAKWNIYAVALQDLTLYSFSYLNCFLNYADMSKAKQIYEQILDNEIKNEMPIEVIEKSKKTFDERINNIDWKKYCRSLPFNKSALALYDWAPVADELKTLDRKIVLNSMILKWDLIKDEFDKLINI